ncbi:MAG: radical SAM family heme chaperone HemW [Chroococcales cyanobacterium]
MKPVALPTNPFKSVNLPNLDAPQSAYIHIPFCRRRCYYCDFPVSVLGNSATGSKSGSVEQYVQVLCQEIVTTPVLSRSLKTIFFGGGTPSLLSVQQLEDILQTLENHFGLAPDVEISIEIDPGTFSREQLQGYVHAGVNRISLGVQAFQDELLKLCGRSHTVKDIGTTIDVISQVGIVNHSLDLISGLPHQTLDQWQESLEMAVSYSPAHLSCYDLIIEPVTAFAKQYQPGIQPLPTDEMAAQMYRLAQQILIEAGYQHYEISNYAKPGYSCRHNRVYWENRAYYGFGMGAASYTQGQRFTRPRKRREYFAWVEEYQKSGGKIDVPLLTKSDRLLETLMLGLRLSEGVDLLKLSQEFGKEILAPIWPCLKQYYQQGWVKIVGETVTDTLPDSGRLKLSDPEGFLFSNTILAELFSTLATEE